MKKLKTSKHRITLNDGRELQYHSPRRPEQNRDLRDFLPRSTLEKSGKLEVEIGCGKGEFIASRSKEFPERSFVGIDRRSDREKLSQKKLQKNPKQNWMIIKEDARCFLEEGIPPIDILHLYHPDPWPKARHHKHRFFRSPDALAWARAIKPGGQFRISTDHKEYFEEIVAIVEGWGFLALELSWVKTHGRPQSYFEKLFLEKAEPVYKVVFRKEANCLVTTQPKKPERKPLRSRSDTSQKPQESVF